MDKKELICICNAVSYETIEDLIEKGASTYEEIALATDAGSVCGGCIERIEEIIERLSVN